MIKLEKITADNLEDVLKLKVSKNQENFVSTTAYSLAQAYVYQENAYPFAIYADDTLVGFIILKEDISESFFLGLAHSGVPPLNTASMICVFSCSASLKGTMYT